MSAPAGTVVLLDARPAYAYATDAALDLERGGFEVVRVGRARELLDAARRRRPDAVVVSGRVGPAAWRAWRQTAALQRVPIVVLGPGKKQRLGLGWPFCAFVRGDMYLSAAEVAHTGTTADAIRAAIARAGGRRTSHREELGEWMWLVGSVSQAIGLLVSIFGLVVTSGSARSGFAWGLSAMLGGGVLVEIGQELGFGRRLTLRRVAVLAISYAGPPSCSFARHGRFRAGALAPAAICAIPPRCSTSPARTAARSPAAPASRSTTRGASSER